VEVGSVEGVLKACRRGVIEVWSSGARYSFSDVKAWRYESSGDAMQA